VNPLEELAELIRAGSVKYVATYGDNKLGLPTPYVVIVPKPSPPNKQAYQIWAHFAIGQNKEIETYVKEELPALIWARKNAFGQKKYKSNGTYDGVSVDGGDNTLRVGRIFYTTSPLIIQ
jgi:hypothetical protein